MKLVIPAITLAILTGFLMGCGGTKQQVVDAKAPDNTSDSGEIQFPPDSPKLREIRVEKVTTAAAPSDELGSPGKVELNPNRVSHVLLPVQGRVTRVFAKIGDAVKQGEPLLAVESPDVDLAMSTYLQAVASLTEARASYSKAQADLDRIRDLFDHNAVPQKDLVNAEAISAQSKAAVDQADAAVQQSLHHLEIFGLKPGSSFSQRLEVRAPVSGKVLEMTVVPGEYRNDTSTPLMTIADLSTVWVTSDVPEGSIRFVRIGERVDIELSAYPDETFQGRVMQIADTVDPETRTVKVRAELQNKDGRLRPEMFARIRLVDKIEQKPVVPGSAVLQGESGPYVIRELSPGRFLPTPVALGSKVGDMVVVSRGLTPGDRIVTDGALLVKN